MSGKSRHGAIYYGSIVTALMMEALASFAIFHWVIAVLRIRRLERERISQPTVSLMAEYRDVPTDLKEKS